MFVDSFTRVKTWLLLWYTYVMSLLCVCTLLLVSATQKLQRLHGRQQAKRDHHCADSVVIESDVLSQGVVFHSIVSERVRLFQCR